VVGETFGLDGLFILVVAIVSIGIPLWAIIDAATKPSVAFRAAGSSKAMWIALIIVFSFFTGIIGLILAIVYLSWIRPRVQAVMT
jgi:uncharacterized protein involved in exopolysaccharide biosynthesis